MTSENELPSEPTPTDSPAARADKLEAKVEAIRDDLGELVGELDRRRHRATKYLPVGAVAVAVLGVGGYALWRVLRSKPSRFQQLGQALQRAKAHPESVAKESSPNPAKTILVAAASAVASVAARRAVARWSSTRAV